MPEGQKVDSFKFTVQPFDDDYTGRLSWSVLGKHVLACAENHAGARGFDRLTLNGHRFLWVLSRMSFDMISWPKLGEEYTISTWICRYYRYFTDRCFDIRDAKGNIIGYVFTIWAMIDETTRKPQVLEELFGHTFDPYIETERYCSIQPFSRIRLDNSFCLHNRPTYYSDIDENNHVNSIRYIEFILDTFPKELFSTHQVGHLEIAYNSESYCGDQLGILVKEVATDKYNIVVKKNLDDERNQQTGETVCHCAVTFEPMVKQENIK